MASSSGQAGKLLFAGQSHHHPSQHQISQAAIQTAGMQGFEESQKRQEIMTSQQQLMAIRNNQNYLMRNNATGSKQDLMRSEEYAGRPPTSQMS